MRKAEIFRQTAETGNIFRKHVCLNVYQVTQVLPKR